MCIAQPRPDKQSASDRGRVASLTRCCVVIEKTQMDSISLGHIESKYCIESMYCKKVYMIIYALLEM